MKKTQFTSLILLILIITIYFMIYNSFNKINSEYLEDNAELLKISNLIKEIEIQDLEYKINLTNNIINQLKYTNSSGTNELKTTLSLEGVIIDLTNQLPLVTYENTYYIDNMSKTINSTIQIPYPINSFLEIDELINNCIGTGGTITDCTNNNINYPIIKSEESTDEYLLIYHDEYILSKSNNYIIKLDS